MKKAFFVSVAAIALVGLSACGKKGEAIEKGQVVATVDGSEITVFELNAEMAGAQVPAGADRKPFEQQALQRIIERKILAKIARDRGLDKIPAFLLQERKQDELILAGMLRDSIAMKIAQPTDTDIQNYITAHPEFFAQRKTFSVDQVIFPAPTTVAKFKELAPLKTIDQFVAKLTADGTPFRHAASKLDTLQLPPDVVKRITALPAGEVFVIPGREGLAANVVTGVNVEPVTGDQARNNAILALRNERFSKAADSQLADTIKKSKAAVVYAAGYSAPPTPKAGATPAPVVSPTEAAPAPGAPATEAPKTGG